MDHADHETDFQNRMQKRKSGSGRGRICRPWVSEWAWVLIAGERLCVYQAGSETSLLKNRAWVEKWGIDENWLCKEMDNLFPGFTDWLLATPGGPNPKKDFKNRIYKMYYNGTSARGTNHDPRTRAAVSKEHWRNKKYRLKWEAKIIDIIRRRAVCNCWRDWVDQ